MTALQPVVREERSSHLESSLGDAPGGVIEINLSFEFHVIRFTGFQCLFEGPLRVSCADCRGRRSLFPGRGGRSPARSTQRCSRGCRAGWAGYDSNEHLDIWIRERLRANFSADRNDNSNAKPMPKQSGAGGPQTWQLPAEGALQLPHLPPNPYHWSRKRQGLEASRRERSLANNFRARYPYPTSSAGGGKHVDDEK